MIAQAFQNICSIKIALIFYYNHAVQRSKRIMQKRLLPAPTKGSAIENEKEKASASRYD